MDSNTKWPIKDEIEDDEYQTHIQSGVAVWSPFTDDKGNVKWYVYKEGKPLVLGTVIPVIKKRDGTTSQQTIIEVVSEDENGTFYRVRKYKEKTP